MDLNTLRPENSTAAAIAAALQRAEAAVADAQQGVTAARARRDTLLLDGTPGQLAGAEKVLAAARDLSERVEAMEEQLRQRHAAAERSELLAGLAAAKAGAESASAEFAQWWNEAEPGFRARIVEGMRLKKVEHDAMFAWSGWQVRAAQCYPDAAADPDHPKQVESAAPDWYARLFDALRGTMPTTERRALGVLIGPWRRQAGVSALPDPEHSGWDPTGVGEHTGGKGAPHR